MKHINKDNNQNFCSKPLTPESLTLDALESASHAEVCPVCVAQVVEEAAHIKPLRYEAYAWPENDTRVFMEPLGTLWGVWAYRLMVEQLLAEQGRKLQNFTYLERGADPPALPKLAQA